jgi:hypothetical protein
MVDQRPQACDQTRIEVLNLFQDVTIGVLFSPAVNPDELAPCVDAKFGKITTAAVNFSNALQMRLLCVESARQTGLEIGR